MKHEELLAKINEYSSSLGDATRRPFFNAMSAVMELHKPEPYDYNEELRFSCSCNQIAPEFLNPYPCPTIQAIEKELS